MDAEIYIFFTAAISLGALAGLGFVVIWRQIVPVGVHAAFWSTMHGLCRGITMVDEAADFLKLYKRLGAAVGVYTARNLGGAVFSCMPLIIIMYTLTPYLLAAWDSRADTLAVVPSWAGTVVSSDDRNSVVLHLAEGGLAVNLDGPMPRAALCWTSVRCAVLGMLEFQVTRLDSSPLSDVSSIVVRVNNGDWNPAWPFLSGLEFMFFLSFIVVVTSGLLLRARS